jgi:hypothetical protein
VRQAERLIALRALLARVQANAKERRAELAALGLGPDAPRPEAVASEPPIHAPAPRHRVRERVPSPRGGFDDDWSSLLTRDLNDPSPERRVSAHEPPAPPAMPFSRVASFAPPALPADLVKAVQATPAPASVRSDEEDRHPDSEIVKAIKLAAEHPHPMVDPRDVWTGAGPQLRERKPATNPPVPPRPEDLEPDDDEPVLDLVRPTPATSRASSRPPPADDPVATSAPSEPPLAPPPIEPPQPSPPTHALPIAVPTAQASYETHGDVTPHPVPSSYLGRSRGRRIERVVSPRKKSANRVLAALVVAAPLAGLAAWSLLDEPRRDARDATSSTPRGGLTAARPAPPTARRVRGARADGTAHAATHRDPAAAPAGQPARIRDVVGRRRPGQRDLRAGRFGG